MKVELESEIVQHLNDNPDESDAVIAKLFKVTRSAVWRVRSRFRAKTILDTTLLNEDEKELYKSFIESKKKPKRKRPWFARIFPLRRTLVDGLPNDFDDTSLIDATRHHNNFLNTYTPQYNVQATDVKFNAKKEIEGTFPFVAKKTSTGRVFFPKFFINPLQALDYIVLQDIYMHTICGSIIDVLVAFTMGRGVRPILKLNSEDEVEIKKSGKKDNAKGALPKEKDETKEEAIARVLDENKSLLDPIIAVDDMFADPMGNDPMLDEDFNSKVEALVRNHWVYGRDVMTYEYFDDRVFEFDGIKYPDIPNVLKILHPRDIGFVQIDQPTLKMVGVQLMFGTGIVESSDMLYLEHMSNSAIYNGKFYGYSKMQRMIGHGRSLRKLIDKDFPNVASIGYAGFSVIAFQEDTKGSEKEEEQNTTFVNNLTIGSPNAISIEDPVNGMHVHNINTDAKISEMIEMAHFHAEAAAKSAEVPTTLVSKEKDPNRDTLLGILRLFLENVIKRHRIKIGKQLTSQWYMKNFRIIYAKKPEVLEKFHVEAEFDDFKLESWADLVNSVIELSKLKPLKAEALGELLGIQNFENMIDPEGVTFQEQSITDNDGNKLTFSKDKSKKTKGAETSEETKD